MSLDASFDFAKIVEDDLRRPRVGWPIHEVRRGHITLYFQNHAPMQIGGLQLFVVDDMGWLHSCSPFICTLFEEA